MVDPFFIILLVLIVGGTLFATIGSKRARRRYDAARTARTGTEQPRTNPLAIIAFVLAFFAAVPAIVCGHVASAQLMQTGEGGWGLARASLWIGYIGTALLVVVGPVLFYYLSQGTWGL